MSSNNVNIRGIVKALGMFQAALPIVRFGRFHLFFLEKLRNFSLKQCLGDYNDYCKLDKESVKELIWWSNNLSSSKKICIAHLRDVVLSDTCPDGWGAVYKKHSPGGHWSNDESLLYINTLEMKAALFAIRICGKNMYSSVHLRVDST